MEETAQSSASEQQTYNAFFYGTLLHPKVLRRVIRHTGANLKISPAVLEGYVRHKVSWAPFPAIISASSSHETFQTEPNEENDCVRGSYVSGLTAMDMVLLDRFESGLYSREHVNVQLLDEPVSLEEIQLETLINLKTDETVKTETVPALTYVWSNPISQLKADPWSFAEFVKTKLDDWI